MEEPLNAPALEVHDLTVSYDRRPALWGVDFAVPTGRLCGVIGPNGAGKSTLIKAVMGLTPAASGYARLFGRPLEEVRARVSYVPQRKTVDWDFPASVFDVALMGRYGKGGFLGRPRRADREAAMNALRKVGMEPFANKQIAQLSGGQQQRVFLARALAQEADFYFLDEPFAGVDMATERAIVELLGDMRDEGKTLLVVHHDLQSAAEYFDWIVLLNMRLVANGPPEEVFTGELLQKTYGGRLTLLSEVGDLMQKGQFPTREEGKKAQ